LDDLIQDVEAVRKHMGEAKIALLGAFHAGPIAIKYAANFPQHVSHLILWCTYAEASDFWANKEVRALNDVLTTNWHDYTEFVAGTVFGWHDETTRRHMVHFLRHSMEPEAVQKSLSAMEKFDVRADLERISAPTLILHAGRFKFVNRSKATGLAGEIPGSELATIEESNGLLLAGAPGVEAAAERMRQFLATTTPAAGVRGLLSRT
jgi:proline iminopeptidase